ncbi:MAG: transcription elongation factor GreA [Omnitrophica WOR_2 bacterium GWF2_43_52]|nr:MAG: transcription elongation factor GreA [Omnitrophica WOR_2 bacterium GWC2_44_8]OGX20661.1 MAG: transcription elongation factor GreA [Omnitrophica WOR_2 bacterium GWF2_43_52]HAH21337.1 transcription elongation factor GreA [Candidatus Omnitrophota bacterium]HBG64310.1 transcription elongation factor GreA [Candidatus Omnitrophota bacterium]HCD37359.1 transcription elongation factor GreA [Candidatus Omnitrophota bacterium]
MGLNEVYLTREGYEKLKQELEYLETTKRREIAKALAHARSLGDLKENAEYDAAKNEQAHCEKKIAELKDKLSRVKILDSRDVPTDQVYLGAKVSLIDIDTDEEFEYMLVSKEEADYEAGKISLDSPVGNALLQKKVNDVVEIKVPAGILKYKIVSITR